MSQREQLRPLGVMADVGGVVATWVALIALENAVVGVVWREQFAGSWEMAHARYYVAPIAVACALPAAVVAVLIARLIAARQAHLVAAVGAVGAMALGVGISSGRHMASLAVRAPFVAALGIGAAIVTRGLVRRAPLERPRRLAALGVAVAGAAWFADATVLPRLYPAFHDALLVLTLAGWASLLLLLRRERAFRYVSFASLGLALFSVLSTPRSARAVAFDDNLRRVLVEHAPVLGRAVRVASRIARPPPLEDDVTDASATAAVVRPNAAARALDWSGRDIVVVTIDALRADHVSSYGYGRATTPNIDRLAARGARFERAYCPTPHTSYSVTSMMTGKYMRPLLGMGATDDSDTWADYLRRYGFRTAAFYPPAVFFIDEHRFRHMKAEGLGFEYRKEEFAAPELRRAQIAEYVTNAPRDTPLFLWVHLFEPHEPYVKHAEHSFGGDGSVDAYDSEVGTADAVVGEIVDLVEKRRPGAVFVVSADHGEEFGDHGGRYHGTTVYEEQVRVPLVVVAPGVAPSVVKIPVQTIDLLPTALAALDVPRPARVRGRDLGSVLAGKAPPPPEEQGLAFAETDDYTLVARGDERLVCVRKIASCTLFDVSIDPRQTRPIVDRPARVQELRRLTAAIERENGTLEANALPEALRRGLQGDRDAAEGVATLFDDARVDLRREAARCAFRLRAPAMKPQLERALAKDEDQEVKRWSALALVRLRAEEGAADAGTGAGAHAGAGAGKDPHTADPSLRTAVALLTDPSRKFRLAAALALAEQGDGRGEVELVARWDSAFVPGAKEPGELEEARELLAALARLRARSATASLARSLDDVRLRPYVADALGEIGDPRAIAPLLATLTTERYVDVRPREARALARLKARDGLLAPLRRFAGVPEPMLEGVEIARELGLLGPAEGGWARGEASAPKALDVHVSVDGTGPARLVALGSADELSTLRVDETPVKAEQQRGSFWVAELPEIGPRARIELGVTSASTAVWIVRRAEEIPPPAPREWRPADGGL
jgi:HEAT repeat protein